jgi:taurine dioxygenase
MVSAYAGLPAALRRFVDGLWALHESSPDGAVVHAVVRVHPETQERALFVNPAFTRHILDLSAHESDAVLRLLFDHIALAEYTVRFTWGDGDVALWDNRVTVHRDVVGDKSSASFLEEFVEPEIPIGVDSSSSRRAPESA